MTSKAGRQPHSAGSPDGSSTPLEHTGLLFRRAQQAHVAAWVKNVSSEVTSPQYGVLNILHSYPGASQRRLCDDLDLDRSTVADIVQRLERRGLLERVRADDDRRRNVLRLTESGEREYAELAPRVTLVGHALVGGLDEAERSELHRLLHRVLDR